MIEPMDIRCPACESAPGIDCTAMMPNGLRTYVSWVHETRELAAVRAA